MAQRRKKTEVQPERTLEAARESVANGCQLLDKCIRRVDEDLSAGEYDTKLGSHLAFLVEHHARATTELRQLEKQGLERDRNLPAAEMDALLCAYLEELPAERRARIRDFLDDTASGGLLSH